MRIFAGIAALASADLEVTDCNAGGIASMAMTIDKADVQHVQDLKDDGWTLDNTDDKWKKTVNATPSNTREEGDGDTKELVFDYTVDSGSCEEAQVDGKTVCIKAGHNLKFTCTYPMRDQDLTEAPFKVSGSDTKDSATRTGTLGYTLALSNVPVNDQDEAQPYKIGALVTATITPATANLVHATVESCSVKRKSDATGVSLITDGMNRECKLGVSVTNGQGSGTLGFQWSSFKWNTERTVAGAEAADEDQELSCKISLSKNAPSPESQGPANCAAEGKTWSAHKYKLKCNGGTTISTQSVLVGEGSSNQGTPDAEWPAAVSRCQNLCATTDSCVAITLEDYNEKCTLLSSCDDFVYGMYEHSFVLE